MLLYTKKENLTLDYFQRGTIHRPLKTIINTINNSERRLSATNDLHVMVERIGMVAIYDSVLSKTIQIALFLSNSKKELRSQNHNMIEKIFSSHVNIYSPYLWPTSDPKVNITERYQLLRAIFPYKQMKFPLGKIRVLDFKK